MGKLFDAFLEVNSNFLRHEWSEALSVPEGPGNWGKLS